MNRFSFTGTPIFPKADAKRPFIRCATIKNDAKRHYYSMNMGIKAADNNIAYVEMFGCEQDIIKTLDKDGNKIEVPWSGRKDSSVVNDVASYRKNIISFSSTERYEFVSSYDAIEFLKENSDKIKDKKITVSGTYQKSEYNGKFYDNFQVQNIYVVSDETKNGLRVTAEIYWNKDCVDKDSWKQDKKIFVNGYTSQYIASEKVNMFVPITLVFDASKVDTSDEKLEKIVNYKLGKIDIKNKTYQRLMFECSYIHGAEEVSFDESMLTPSQKEMVDLGLKKLEDFKPNGSVYGNSITEMKIYNFYLKGEYEDGMVDTEMSEDDFSDQIYKPEVKEAEATLEAVVEEKEEKKSLNDEFDDLFS